MDLKRLQHLLLLTEELHFSRAAQRANLSQTAFSRSIQTLERELGVPVIGFYHSDLPRLVERRFGRAWGRAAAAYVRHLYRRFDRVLTPSRTMVEHLAAIGVEGAIAQPLGVDTAAFSPARRTSCSERSSSRAADWPTCSAAALMSVNSARTCPTVVFSACPS